MITDIKPKFRISSENPNSGVENLMPSMGIKSRISGINTNLSALFGVAVFGEVLFGEEYYFTKDIVTPSSVVKSLKPTCQ